MRSEPQAVIGDSASRGQPSARGPSTNRRLPSPTRRFGVLNGAGFRHALCGGGGMQRRDPKALAQRQERVAKLVWGSLFVVMGILFTLHDMGRIDLGEPGREFAAEHAVDGDVRTRWSSEFRDPQWLTVDLGAPVPLGKVRINWEDAYAKDYELQLSNDGIRFTSVRRIHDSVGGVEDDELEGTARFVRLLGTKRSTGYGYSLWELQVFDPSGQLVSEGKPVRASSLENQSPFALWAKFWPMLLVAGGLPLFLAPRDDASQIVGVVLAGLGTVVQLS